MVIINFWFWWLVHTKNCYILCALKLVIHPGKIAIHYLKGWFLIDMVAAIPFDLLLFGSQTDEVIAKVFTNIIMLKVVLITWCSRQLLWLACSRQLVFSGWCEWPAKLIAIQSMEQRFWYCWWQDSLWFEKSILLDSPSTNTFAFS